MLGGLSCGPGVCVSWGWGWHHGAGLGFWWNIFTDCSRAVLLLWIICVICVCRAFASDHCCLVVACLEGAGLLALGFWLCFCRFPMWCPGLGVVLDCVGS